MRLLRVAIQLSLERQTGNPFYQMAMVQFFSSILKEAMDFAGLKCPPRLPLTCK